MLIRTIVPAKELSWIDRMYEKLENICVEVDKNPFLLFQETSKYVENHMNVVGTNVRKLCNDLIDDLLPPSSEVAVKKPESTIFCNCECVASEKPKQGASEKPKQKAGTKSCKITDFRNGEVLEDVQDKGCKAAVSVPEDHCSLGRNGIHTQDNGKVLGIESEASRLGEVATQREGTGKEVEREGYTSSLEEHAMWPEVAGKEGDMTIKQCMEGCVSHHKAQQPVEDAQMAAAQGMDGGTCNPKPTSGSIASSEASCYKDGELMMDSGFLFVQEVEEEQTAQWFVSEDQRKIYVLENSLSSSSLEMFDGARAQGPVEDLDSDWEFM